MHELMEFVCNELKEIEKKAKNGRLTIQEVQYADTLAHLKKNLLTAEAMSEGESHDGASYRRGRDSMGRYVSREAGTSHYYSRDDGMDDLESHLYSMEQSAPNEETRRMIREWKRQLKG